MQCCLKKFTDYIFFFFLILLNSCSFEPQYQKPSVAVAEKWKSAQNPPTDIPSVEHWWEIFQDPQLSNLIQQASENNPSLKAAAERVEQAQDFAKIVKSKLFPQINLDPVFSNESFLNKYPFGPNSHHPFTTKQHQLQYFLPLNLSWEIDLWGKIRSEHKAALLNAESQQEAYQNILLILTTDLASAYFQLRVQDAQIVLFQLLVKTREKALELNRSRFEGKIIDFAEVALAQQDLDGVKAEYYNALQARALLENQIAVLIGVSPSEFSLGTMPLTQLPPLIPAGLPSDILLRRPDLAEQERNMASIHARLGIAYASYFPSLELTAGLGSFSPSSFNFLKEKSLYWMGGANIAQFIFDAGKRHNTVKLAWAQFQEAAELYRQSVLNAFREVEDSLSNLDWIAKEMESLQDSVQAAKTNYTISADRFKFGVINYLDVVSKQRQELDNERAYLSLLSMRYLNTIQLVKAIGGGWNTIHTKVEECGSLN